ncbi:MAG: formate dehydrogenase accessory sulfurtransferase FdhD [Ramlibacter sp.]
MNSIFDHGIQTGADTLSVAVRRVWRVRDGAPTLAEDMVADEVPVALVYNDISHAVMLTTPADLEDFALGFSLSEGILDSPGQCYGVEVEPAPDGITVAIEVAGSAFARLKDRRRSMAGRTGCGLCGVESLAQLRRSLPPLQAPPGIEAGAVAHALSAIADGQALTRRTGAAHAAAWCAPDGALLALREDVGRHNALDKLIGAMARGGLPANGGFLLLTSRVSMEMVQKAAMAGIGLLAGMSAPTLAAIEAAEDAGMTLLAFARGQGFVCYAHPAGIGLPV